MSRSKWAIVRSRVYQGRETLGRDLIVDRRVTVAPGETAAGRIAEHLERAGFDGRLEECGGHGPAAVIALTPGAAPGPLLAQAFLLGDALAKIFKPMDADYFVERGARPPGSKLKFEFFDLSAFKFKPGSLTGKYAAPFKIIYPNGTESPVHLHHPIDLRVTLQTRARAPSSSRELSATFSYRPQDAFTHRPKEQPGRMLPEIKLAGPIAVRILPENPKHLRQKNGLGFGTFLLLCRPERLAAPVHGTLSRDIKQVISVPFPLQ